jgi:hypothetical protein
MPQSKQGSQCGCESQDKSHRGRLGLLGGNFIKDIGSALPPLSESIEILFSLDIGLFILNILRGYYFTLAATAYNHRPRCAYLLFQKKSISLT